eukprot:CAMPEP_0119016064 /NCGR_PEP_ID=MMETSP1176-20130426/11796_1 /TAXON_ID=265551 /ORGANISM="Synedropsis recta cf, Strain CCMP1620" /LENGTH=234 /DNA_ID=CAMNT_0006969391 /DNA_START=38 /DNA_END=742 /DNA_ORIENTATION=+
MSLHRRSSSLVVRNKQMLPADYVPGSFDVICARGVDAHRHNQRFFRRTIQMHSRSLSSQRLEPNEIVERIIDTVRQRSISGGFIRQDPCTGLYFEVGDFHARQKVSQTLKEVLSLRRQEGSKRRRKWGQVSSSIEVEQEPCYYDNETDEEEITAPPMSLNCQSSLSSSSSSSSSFEPDQFRMSKCSHDLMDDDDCSDLEDFFDIRRIPSNSSLGDNYLVLQQQCLAPPLTPARS